MPTHAHSAGIAFCVQLQGNVRAHQRHLVDRVVDDLHGRPQVAARVKGFGPRTACATVAQVPVSDPGCALLLGMLDSILLGTLVSILIGMRMNDLLDLLCCCACCCSLGGARRTSGWLGRGVGACACEGHAAMRAERVVL